MSEKQQSFEFELATSPFDAEGRPKVASTRRKDGRVRHTTSSIPQATALLFMMLMSMLFPDMGVQAARNPAMPVRDMTAHAIKLIEDMAYEA